MDNIDDKKDVEKTKNEYENISEEERRATLRVASKTDAKDLAGAITATVKEHGYVYLRAIGDGAIGSAMKAATISSGHLKTIGINLISETSFFLTTIDGNERTGLKILCENR